MINYGISVIICVHNGASRIIPTLKALAEQNIPSGLECELLMIDNASTDNTAIIAADYWVSVGSPFSFRILTEPNPGKANALVMGYNAALNELILLCDDDNWLQPDYLKTVLEIYTLYPQIGLLGGYGKALFANNEKPVWFDKWERCYVCGKHHLRNGFLKNMDFSIWGAGSVMRKTIWTFLYSNGFVFYNGNNRGKAMTEDAELSMAITFTGHSLYFDDRLWFIHDLRGRKINWKSLLAQQSLNGQNTAILYMYRLAYDNILKFNLPVNWLFSRKIIGLTWRICGSFRKWDNYPERIFLFNIIKELLSNQKKYKKLALASIIWISKIKNAFPLDNNNKQIN
ncbi:MAG: glycosyltransferase family A protein [Bacteroidota bacterium]